VGNYNKNKPPFTWTATADSILEKPDQLCLQISGTAHQLTGCEAGWDLPILRAGIASFFLWSPIEIWSLWRMRSLNR
jgi:hypothetical protein